MIVRRKCSMATFGLTQDGSKVSPDEGETLFDAAGYSQFGSGLGHPIVPGEYPNRSRAIVDFEGAASRGAIGVDYLSCNRNLFARITSGIPVYLGNAHPGRAPGQQGNS